MFDNYDGVYRKQEIAQPAFTRTTKWNKFFAYVIVLLESCGVYMKAILQILVKMTALVMAFGGSQILFLSQLQDTGLCRLMAGINLIVVLALGVAFALDFSGKDFKMSEDTLLRCAVISVLAFVPYYALQHAAQLEMLAYATAPKTYGHN